MQKKFKTKYGYFAEDGKEYIITNYNTPKPWINVISNGNYGLVVSQVNGGFSWITHSNFNRLTRWQQDLTQDNWGKYIYLRDEETGKFWSPTIQPVLNKPDNYECHHGIGYTIFCSEFTGIETSLRIFVPFDDDLEIWSLKIKNLSGTSRRIGAYTYFEWCLGAAPDNHREFHKIFIETRFDEDKKAFFATKRLSEIANNNGHWNANWDKVAYFACDKKIDEFEGDKNIFIGRNRSLSNPAAVENGKLSNSQGKWNDSIASLKKIVELNPGEEKEIHFYLGAEDNELKASNILGKYGNSESVERAFTSTKKNWLAILDKTTVETPDEALNIMTNNWLKYQTISGRLWGRAAYYQQSGAYGFRDQLQDSLVFLYHDPEQTLKTILLHARHQFEDGRVLHWWHPITEEGIDANMTDDLLWLPFVVVQYLKETADWKALEETVPFYDNPEPVSLLDHCVKAIEKTLSRFSERGLPLILAGDWNDGLSAVGLEGKGESIWLAHFLYYVLDEFQTVLSHVGLSKKENDYKQKAENLKFAINKYGWDGEWFWRASKDSGELIGSKENKEGKIFLNPQTWSIIANSTDDFRKQASLKSVEKYLEGKVGPQLFDPAYKDPDSHIGYLSRYAPGVRENGGVYTHAATWLIWAASLQNDSDMAYRTLKKLNPVYNGMSSDEYMAEPYVTPGNIDGKDSPYYGRGGWTWYTGSAAWLYRVTIDYLLGIQADYSGLRIKPCFPNEWKEIKVNRFFRGVNYKIHIYRDNSIMANTMEIYMNGDKINSKILPPVKNNIDAEVIVKIN